MANTDEQRAAALVNAGYFTQAEANKIYGITTPTTPPATANTPTTTTPTNSATTTPAATTTSTETSYEDVGHPGIAGTPKLLAEPSAPTAVVAPAVTPTASDSSSTSAMIDSQAAQALAARTAALEKARDTAITGYTQQQEALPGQYQPLRDQASFQGAKGVNTINESTAGQGLFNSGTNVTSQTANATNTASDINTLNVQQQDEVNKLQQAIVQAQANYGYDLAGATGEVESDKLAALIAQANTDKGFSLTQQQLDNQNYQFDKTYDQTNSQFGVTSGQNQQQIDNQASQNAAALAQSASQFGVTSGQSQQQIDNSKDYNNALLTQNDVQFKQTFGLDQEKLTLARDQAKVDNANALATLTGYTADGKATMQQKSLDQASSQFKMTFDQNDAQFAETMKMDKAQLAAQVAQYGAANAIQMAGIAQNSAQFAASMQMDQTNAVNALTQWAMIYNSGLNQDAVTNGISAAAQLGIDYKPISGGSAIAIIQPDGTLGWMSSVTGTITPDDGTTVIPTS